MKHSFKYPLVFDFNKRTVKEAQSADEVPPSPIDPIKFEFCFFKQNKDKKASKYKQTLVQSHKFDHIDKLKKGLIEVFKSKLKTEEIQQIKAIV